MQITIYLDTQRQVIVGSPSQTSAATLPALYRGDQLHLRIQLLAPTGDALRQPYRILPVDNYSMKVAIGTADGNVVAMQTTWTQDTLADYFTAVLDLHTPEVEAAFVASNNTSLSKLLEIELTDAGGVATALQIPVTIRPDVIRQGTLLPEAFTPPSALADNLSLLLQDSATIDVARNGDEFTFNVIGGATGPAGPAGPEALWNYRGAYSGGTAYAIGDVATYAGQSWYRRHANGGNLGDTPSAGTFWDLLAAKGADGATGATGPAGPTGATGATGPAGSGGSGSGEANTASNVGTGGGQIFKAKTGVDLELRTITAGAGISVGTSGNEISIASTGSGPSMTVGNIGSGNGVYYGLNATTLMVELKSLAAGSGVSITDDGVGTLTLSNSVTGAGGIGSGNSIFYGNNAGTLEFKSLTAGNGVSITDDGVGSLTLTPAVQGAENIGTGTGLFYGVSSGQLQFKSLATADGIVITDDGLGTLTLGMPVIGSSTSDVECKNFRVHPQAATTAVIDMNGGSLQLFSCSDAALTFSLANAADGKMTTMLVDAVASAITFAFPAEWIFFGAMPTGMAQSEKLLLNVTQFGSAHIVASAVISE